jgi:hypothetical protein
MLTAGTLGTALGDFAAAGLGLVQSAVIFSTILAVVLVLRSRAELKTKLIYWLAIVVVRTAGTNLADFLAGKGAESWACPQHHHYGASTAQRGATWEPLASDATRARRDATWLRTQGPAPLHAAA